MQKYKQIKDRKGDYGMWKYFYARIQAIKK